MIKPFHVLLTIIGFMFGAFALKQTQPQISKSNEDLYLILHEPLLMTFLYEGRTLSTTEQGQFFIEYSFDGWMTGTPYKISIARNLDFGDCAGCIGSPYTGMLTPPEHGGNFISLKEFIVQMVKANDENNDHNGEMLWHSKSGYTWEIVSKKNHTVISAWPKGGQRKYVYIET